MLRLPARGDIRFGTPARISALQPGLSEISNLYGIHGYEKKDKMMMQWRDQMENDSRSIIWCSYEHQKSWW